jgi:MSHA biogenesis protein MshP
MTHRSVSQHGFAAIAAIFLVVVLAALGGFMVTFSNTQQLTSAQDIQGTRAYWAARAGLAWRAASVKAASTACVSSSTLNNLEGFSVDVTCNVSSYQEGASTVTIYRFVAKASAGTPGSPGYVERSLSAAMEL